MKQLLNLFPAVCSTVQLHTVFILISLRVAKTDDDMQRFAGHERSTMSPEPVHTVYNVECRRSTCRQLEHVQVWRHVECHGRRRGILHVWKATVCTRYKTLHCSGVQQSARKCDENYFSN